MESPPLLILILIFTLLDVHVQSEISSSSQSHSFLQTNEDIRYMVESIPVPKDFSPITAVRYQTVEGDEKSYLKFHPPILKFKARHAGVPHHEKVIVINTSCNKSVHLSSISGNSLNFHSSFFQDKVVPPLGNTSFDVVFLGRGEGIITSFLFIHTSEGSIKYEVEGDSLGSPYRIRPLSGVRLPLNASYSPLIFMHNPHGSPLQLMEVYSSGGDFHLELPSGELEGPKHLWQIPAFLTKPIIRLRFHATSERNHTAYIRLKVDRSEDVLIVPVEVEVGPSCGLYSPDDLIDFGIGGSEDAPKKVDLYLRNSWKRPIRVQNIASIPSSRALKINFEPVKILPYNKESIKVAELTFDWKAAYEADETSGQIVVKSSLSGQKVIVGYTATILPGGMVYNQSLTSFRTDELDDQKRLVTLANNYLVPVAITNASLAPSAEQYFRVQHFYPSILMPKESRELLTLTLKDSLPKDFKFESTLFIFSNVSTLSIPILCYNGRLEKIISSIPNTEELNLGTLGSGSSSHISFGLVNDNPIEVEILDVGTNLTGADISIIRTVKGSVTDAVQASTTMALHLNSTSKSSGIPPGHFSVLQIIAQAGQELGYFEGVVWVVTTFEKITTPIRMRVENGSLRVVTSPVVFQNCFPSAVCSAEVRVESTFAMGMAVTGVVSLPYEARFGFIPVSPPLIPPKSNTLLGYITWDMTGLDTYFSTSSSMIGSHRWLDSLKLPLHTREWDLNLLSSRYERYLNLSSELIELSLRLDTTEVRNLDFQARLQPTWPTIAQCHSRSLEFPLTQVGNISSKSLTLFNPASKYPIVVQLVLDPNYPMASGLVHELPHSLRPFPCNICCESTGDDSEPVFQVSVDSSFSSSLGIEPHKKSVTFILAPSSKIDLNVTFKPRIAEFNSAILMIRNNLTVLEMIQLSGSGAYTQFKFGNRKPGSSNPLVFELADKHLKDCEKDVAWKGLSPNLTVKRSFTARNTGLLPLSILGFTINGHPCQGFGFRILNCHPFHLQPNSTKKVDIAFTPDFTLSRITRVLGILTVDSTSNYSLVATLPPYLLASCSAVLGRPAWEPLLYYSAISFMLFLLICVVTAAYFESNRILRNTIFTMSKDHCVQPVLDLRNVGMDIASNYSSSNTSAKPESPLKKEHWNPLTSVETEVPKERAQTSDDSLGREPVSVKRKSDRPPPLRKTAEVDLHLEKSSWDPISNKSMMNQKVTKTSTICITTEPYTPLTNMKREMGKSEHQGKASVFESQPKKQKKKHSTGNNEESRKKSVETVIIQRSIEEAETSSTTTESSSNDDTEKEVESMFFRSVRHHLQSKTLKNRQTKVTETSQVNCPKKPVVPEKTPILAVENEWDEDHLLATVVRSHRRPNLNNRIRKQNSNGNNTTRNRTEQTRDQPNQRSKGNNGDRNSKLNAIKDKPQLKKRSSKAEKHNTSSKLSGTVRTENISPAIPLTPVWAASFSDVVARTEPTYSSVVALKNHQQPMPKGPTKQQGPPPSVEPIGAKRPLNNVWTNWPSFTEQQQQKQLQQQQHQASANSLFTDSPPSVQNPSTMDNVWTNPSLMKVLQDQRLLETNSHYETQQSFNEVNWPLMTPLWEPLCTPPVETSAPAWRSNVWAPPPPRTPTPPMSTPPMQSNQYDPFRSFSTIWGQHSPIIWKPPTTE